MCLRNICMAPYRWKSQIANWIIVKQTIHGYEISNTFIRNGFKNCPAPWDDYGRKILRWTRFGFCEKNLSIFSDFLSRKKLTQKTWAILQNFNSWMIKLTKIQILPNSKIEILKNYSAFVVCRFLLWRKIWENWEKIRNT